MYPSGWRSLIGIPAIGWSDPGLPPPLLAGSPPWRSRSSWPPSLPPELVCATGPSSSPCSSPDGGGPRSSASTAATSTSMLTSASTPTGARVGSPDGVNSQSPPSGLPTLAPVGVEADVAIEGEVAAGQAEDLGPPPSGEEQGEEDGPVAQTNSGGRDGGQELLDLQGGEPARRGGGSPGSLQPIAGIPINDLHPEGYIYSDSRCHTLIHADSFRGL